jgi:hypothetical protein
MPRQKIGGEGWPPAGEPNSESGWRGRRAGAGARQLRWRTGAGRLARNLRQPVLCAPWREALRVSLRSPSISVRAAIYREDEPATADMASTPGAMRPSVRRALAGLR